MQTPSSDYFEFFGLEPRLTIDTADLQKRFYALSRQWHPDRFTLKPPSEQQVALEATAILNDGFRVLKDPVLRAEYVLKNNGFEIGEQRTNNVPPELLEEVFELNMALEELRSGDESARPQLEAEEKKFAAMRAGVDQELNSEFARYDASRDRNVLAAIRGLLNRRKYIENLIREVDRALAGVKE
jgi:molecular chaperone HscB